MVAARRPTTRSSAAAMPSSSTPADSSSSSVQILDPIPARTPDATTVDTSDSDDGTTDSDDAVGSGRGGSAPSWPAAERLASSLRSQKALDALCKKHGVDTREFAPLPAGDRRACSPPPAGAVCVYADALEAGMRVPLRPFFAEFLSYFGLAPSQLAPNCWRVMAAFAALCRSAGVHPPPVAVFRHLFVLRALKNVKGIYCFVGKDIGVALFTGLPDSIKGWKERFFFLKPWSGRRIPASSACAYTQTAPGGRGEHARWWPAGRIGRNCSGTPYFRHRASRESWVRNEDAKRSATVVDSALPPPPLTASSSLSTPSRAASAARARMGSTWRGEEEAPMM